LALAAAVTVVDVVFVLGEEVVSIVVTVEVVVGNLNTNGGVDM